jgi:hypothetical protein
VCFEVRGYDRKALWAEPTDVVGVTCRATLEMMSAEEITLQRPRTKLLTLTRVVVGASVGTGRASIPLNWRKSPKTVVRRTVIFMIAQAEWPNW